MWAVPELAYMVMDYSTTVVVTELCIAIGKAYMATPQFQKAH